MRERLAVPLLLLSIALPTFGRVRAVRHPASFPAPRSVMWIAAHPDDEALVAPLLSAWCREQNAHCTMLILTRGDAGECLLAGGCVPDVASVRGAEAGGAAELFHADLILLRLPDGGGTAPPVWPEITERIRASIESVRPELILTFDPRHGSTCHPDHRATAEAVLAAVPLLSYEPSVELLETRVEIDAEPFTIHFSSATPSAARFDAASGWNAIVEDMQRHPSQFDERWIEAIRNVPVGERAVFSAPADAVLADAVRGCP